MNIHPPISKNTRVPVLRKAKYLLNLLVSQFDLMKFAIKTAQDHTLAFRMLEASPGLMREIHQSLGTLARAWSVFDINSPTGDEFLEMRADLQALSPEYTKRGFVFLNTQRRWVLFLHVQPGLGRCLPLIFQYRGGATTLFRIAVGESAGLLPAMSETMREEIMRRRLVPWISGGESFERFAASSGPVRDKKWQVGGIVTDTMPSIDMNAEH